MRLSPKHSTRRAQKMSGRLLSQHLGARPGTLLYTWLTKSSRIADRETDRRLAKCWRSRKVSKVVKIEVVDNFGNRTEIE